MSERAGHATAKYFAGGIAAGALAIGVSLLLRSFVGGPFLPELASQTLFALTPGEVESQAVQNFGPLAKYSAFIGAIIINFILYGLFGIIVSKILNKLQWRGYIRKVLLSSLVAYVILLIISISLFTAIQLRTGAIFSVSLAAGSLILPQIVFGFIFTSFFRGKRQTFKKANEPIADTRSMNNNRSRRDFLHLIIVSAVALPILYFGLNRLFSGQGQGQEQEQNSIPSSKLLPQSKSKPVGFEDPMLTPLLASELTPTYLFYRIDIDPVVPVVDSKTWNLNVKGLVSNPLTVTYDEIRAMPSIDEYAT